MKRSIVLALIGVSNYLAWNSLGLFFILTVACIFYLLKGLIDVKWYKVIFLIFGICFTLNITATFWLVHVSWWESLLAFLENSLVMTLPLLLIYGIYRRYKMLLLPFLVVWLSFEVLHTLWDFAWPWMIFGHVMGNQFYLVQWYSLFGVYAGSAWLLSLGYYLFKLKENKLKFFLLLILPSLVSLYQFSQPPQMGDKIRVTTYVPENLEGMSNYKKAKTLFQDLGKKAVEKYVVCPEVFFGPTSTSTLLGGIESLYLRKFRRKHKNTLLICGAEINNGKGSLFNSAIGFHADSIIMRTKMRHVPIREYTPPYLQGIFGKSYYCEAAGYESNNGFDITKIYPTICYETIFSGFLARQSCSADVIFALTSERFMNGSDHAKRQYLNIMRLRAIENNRNILKCSYQGISCVINEQGTITQIVAKKVDTVELYRIREASFYQEIISWL